MQKEDKKPKTRAKKQEGGIDTKVTKKRVYGANKCHICDDKDHFHLPSQISRPYRKVLANRNLKITVLTALVSVIAILVVFSLVSLITSAFRVKTQTRLDHVKDKACMNLVKRLDNKSDAAKHLAFQNCADLYVKDDLQTINK